MANPLRSGGILNPREERIFRFDPPLPTGSLPTVGSTNRAAIQLTWGNAKTGELEWVTLANKQLEFVPFVLLIVPPKVAESLPSIMNLLRTWLP